MRTRATLSALAALSVLTACSAASGDAGADTAASSGDAFPVSIEHAFGSTTIQERPERVVTLGWSAQDVAYALGVPPVGMTGPDSSLKSARSRSKARTT